jgi:RNA-directed DNA polymerase
MIIERNIRPAVVEFLAIRGLQLSDEKSLITHIKHGFTFLGQTFRKTGNTLHITPSKEGVLHLIRKVGTLIRKYTSAPVVILIKKLNEALRGWANYHRHVVASKAFKRVDTYVYEQLWRMIRRRHPNKSKKWLAKKYWLAIGKKWLFSIKYKTESGKEKVMHVIRTSSIGIRRHRKVKADANPYLAEYGSYFYQRQHNKEFKLLQGLTSRQTRLALQLSR